MALVPRRRYFHGAVDVSGLGKNEPRITAAGDYVASLEASPVYNHFINRPIDVATTFDLGWIPEGTWWAANPGLTHHLATTGAGDITLQYVEYVAGVPQPPVTILNVADTSVAPAQIPVAPLLTPFADDILLQLVVNTAGNADDRVLFTLQINATTPERDA